MKKRYIVLIVIACILFYLLPIGFFVGVIAFDSMTYEDANIEIDSYRLCQDKDGNDVIIVKYLIENKGEESTCLFYESEIYVYQDGVSLSEVYDLPKKCDYDDNDQHKQIKGGAKYYAEIAYELEYDDKEVEVEVTDYNFFKDKFKTKTFELK